MQVADAEVKPLQKKDSEIGCASVIILLFLGAGAAFLVGRDYMEIREQRSTVLEACMETQHAYCEAYDRYSDEYLRCMNDEEDCSRFIDTIEDENCLWQAHRLAVCELRHGDCNRERELFDGCLSQN